MSIYTEAEHAIALTDTVHWIEHPPTTAVEQYAYGLYQYRLKDYNEAFHRFSIAAGGGIPMAWFDLGQCFRLNLIDGDVISDLSHFTDVPQEHCNADLCYKKAWEYYGRAVASSDDPSSDGHFLFRRAFLLRYGFGTASDTDTAYSLFQDVIDLYPDLKAEDFDICCNYSTEGSAVSAPTETFKLPVGSALFELAKYYMEGLSPVEKDISKARKLLKQAYDFHCEEALLTDYTQLSPDYTSYEYQDDIRELYSFRIGQFVRVTDVNPSDKAYLRLIAMYDGGYPGDDAQRQKLFAMKAAPLRKKLKAETSQG